MDRAAVEKSMSASVRNAKQSAESAYSFPNSSFLRVEQSYLFIVSRQLGSIPEFLDEVTKRSNFGELSIFPHRLDSLDE